MTIGLRESDQGLFVEYRSDKAYVAKVGPASVGIIDGVYIAWIHVALEHADHVLAGVVKRPDMDGDVRIALCHAVTVGVMQTV